MKARERIQLALDGEDPVFGPWMVIILYSAIALSAVLITVQSMPSLDSTTRFRLSAIESALLALFIFEYLVRIWAAEKRLRYIFSFWGIVDFVAIVPAMLFLFLDAPAIRLLRLMRLFRVLKLFRMGKAVERLENAVREVADELLLFSFLALIVLFLSAVGIYHFESQQQPDVFGSIPQSLWWSIATLTTVGYGDVYPITALGKAFTAFSLLIGLGIVAIPAALITSALISKPKSDTKLNELDTGD